MALIYGDEINVSTFKSLGELRWGADMESARGTESLT